MILDTERDGVGDLGYFFFLELFNIRY